MASHGEYRLRERPTCELAPRKYEPRVHNDGSRSSGLGRGVTGFWNKVRKTESCWLWCGYVDKDGHGKWTTRGPATLRPHRVAWQEANGEIPAGLMLVAICGNRICVRPDHHRPMTNVESWAWVRQTGRTPEPPDNRGEMSGRTRLRDDDVLFIRSQRKIYGLVPLLARLFDVKPQVITHIRSRRTWKHLGNGNVGNSMSLGQLRALLASREESRSLDELAEARDA